MGAHVSDFRYVASFQNEGDSNSTVIENRGQLSRIFTTDKIFDPCNIRVWIREISECYFHLQPSIQPLIYLWQDALVKLRDLMSGPISCKRVGL